LVGDDGTDLFVKYLITVAGWCITETHLHVADTMGEVPQKNGNPTPGHFTYNDEHDCVTEYMYTIPLGDVECGEDNLIIAAHAVVEKTVSGTITPDLTWQRSAEPTQYCFDGYGGQWTPAEGFAIPLDPQQTVWDNGAESNSTPNPGHTNTPPPIPGREYASWYYACNDGMSYAGVSDLRRFQATFTLPTGYTVTSGFMHTPSFADGIPINDNIYIFVNGQLLFWGGTRANTIGTFQGESGTQGIWNGSGNEPLETDGWYLPGEIPEVTDFVSGTNTIDIFTEENERWGGMGRPVLDLEYEKTEDETAWGDGGDFPGRNWATYIDYTVQCCCEEGVVYGTSRGSESAGGGRVYKINLSDFSAEELWVTHPTDVGRGDYPNGNAYDQDNERFYYTSIHTNPTKLYFYKFSDDTGDHEAGSLGRGTQVACGTLYNGEYYFIRQGGKILYKVALHPVSGELDGPIQKRYEITSGPITSFGNFGDIVVDQSTGMLYGSSSNSRFWYIDLSDLSTEGELNTLDNDFPKFLQLAFSSDGVLYGHDAGGGTFYTIDLDADPVTATFHGTVNFPTGGPRTFTDLASGPACD
jgi:hypothetical protein